MLNFLPLASIGLYNFGYMIGTVLNMIINAINLAWMPHFFEVMHKKKDPNPILIKELSHYIIIIGAICLFGVLFNYEVIYYLLPKAYRGATPYIGPVLLGYFFVGLNKFAYAPLFFHKKTGLIPLITGVSALANIVLNIWLIPIYGPLASAWITTFSYLLSCFISFIVTNRFQAINYPYVKYSLLVIVLFVAIIGVNQYIKVDIYYFMIKLALLLLLIPLFYLYINNRSLKDILKLLYDFDIEK